jgi:hypothetical protein
MPVEYHMLETSSKNVVNSTNKTATALNRKVLLVTTVHFAEIFGYHFQGLIYYNMQFDSSTSTQQLLTVLLPKTDELEITFCGFYTTFTQLLHNF